MNQKIKRILRNTFTSLGISALLFCFRLCLQGEFSPGELPVLAVCSLLFRYRIRLRTSGSHLR